MSTSRDFDSESLPQNGPETGREHKINLLKTQDGVERLRLDSVELAALNSQLSGDWDPSPALALLEAAVAWCRYLSENGFGSKAASLPPLPQPVKSEAIAKASLRKKRASHGFNLAVYGKRFHTPSKFILSRRQNSILRPVFLFAWCWVPITQFS